MTSNEIATPGSDSSPGKTGPLPFDTSVAHQARVYDYLLGGKDNYAADRAWAEATLDLNESCSPGLVTVRAGAGF